MNFSLSDNRNIKLAIIILLAGYFTALIMFNGTMDDFAPLHTTVIQETAEKGSISQKDSIQIPGFYSLGAVFVELVHFNSINLLYYPIQIIPHMIVFFLLCYTLSNNYLISSLVTFLDITSGNATVRSFFWCHGIGFILFFLLIICIIKYLYSLYQNNFSISKTFFALSIILGTSLIFISYDYFAIFDFFLIILIYLFVFMLALYLLKIEYFNISLDKYKASIVILSIIFLFLNTIEFFIHGFFENVFIPTIEETKSARFSVTEKFLSQYFSPNLVISPLKDQLFTSTSLITAISMIKYLILIFFIIICIYKIYQYLMLKKIYVMEIFLIAFILSSVIFTISRSIILRQIMFDSIFIPGIFCMLWIYKNSIKLRKVVFLSVLFLILLTQLYYFENVSNEKYNFNKSNFSDEQFVAKWYFDYLKDFRIIKSDVSTYYMIFLYSQKYSEQLGIENDFDYNTVNTILTVDDVLFLIQKSDIIPQNNVFFINYKLNYFNLQNWILMKPWNYSKKQIEGNKNLDKIYSGDDIGAYYSISKAII